VKVSVVGDTVALAALPAPDKATVCGLLPAESVKVSVPLRVPVTEGVNVTPTVQVPEPASVAPQVFAEIAKSPAFVPEIAMLEILIDAVPPFVSVTL
jgi:hypothetical protein